MANISRSCSSVAPNIVLTFSYRFELYIFCFQIRLKFSILTLNFRMNLITVSTLWWSFLAFFNSFFVLICSFLQDQQIALMSIFYRSFIQYDWISLFDNCELIFLFSHCGTLIAALYSAASLVLAVTNCW
jgi:hypothetical protein